MVYMMRVRNSTVASRVGTPKVDLGSSRLYVYIHLATSSESCPNAEADQLVLLKALEFGEIKGMADKAGLFKLVVRVSSARFLVLLDLC